MNVEIFYPSVSAQANLEMSAAALALLRCQYVADGRACIGFSSTTNPTQSTDFIMVAKAVEGYGNPQFCFGHALNKARK